MYETLKQFNKEMSKTESNLTKTIGHLSYTKEERERIYSMNFKHIFDKMLKTQITEILEKIDVIKKSMKYRKSDMKIINKFLDYINKYYEYNM